MNHKFRVWDKRCKRFVHDVLLDEDGEAYEIYNDHGGMFSSGLVKNNVTQDVVIQMHTGLTDLNGQEIYEGDILGYPESLGDKTLYEVRWGKAYSGEQFCEFRTQNLNGDSVKDTEPSDYYGGISQNEYKIVVGNIFEGINK